MQCISGHLHRLTRKICTDVNYADHFPWAQPLWHTKPPVLALGRFLASWMAGVLDSHTQMASRNARWQQAQPTCRTLWHTHAFQKMTVYFSLVLLLFCLPWNRNSNALGKVVIWSSSKASKTVYFGGLFFCRKLPSTQKVATLIAVEKDNFHPLQKNQRVKYPGSRPGGFKCEL